MKRMSLAIIVGLGMLFVGCGKSKTPDAASNGAAPGALPTAAIGSPQAIPNAGPAVPPNAEPGVVVAAFLDAARTANEKVANELLTRKAREETTKADLTINPPGTPSMKYKVEKVEYAQEDPSVAYVNSIWTETLAGMEDSFEVVWVLRKQSDGWRIAGMAAQTVPGEQPAMFNFEDALDVQRIKSQVNSEPGTDDPAANSVTIDIGTQTLRSRSVQARFELLPRHRRMFLEGLDSIGLSLTYEDQIAAFARRHWTRAPWLKDVAATARARLGNT